eukprot:481877-Rhodomonas_salina.3
MTLHLLVKGSRHEKCLPLRNLPGNVNVGAPFSWKGNCSDDGLFSQPWFSSRIRGRRRKGAVDGSQISVCAAAAFGGDDDGVYCVMNPLLALAKGCGVIGEREAASAVRR